MRLLCFIICVVFVHDFSVAELLPTVSKFMSYNCLVKIQQVAARPSVLSKLTFFNCKLVHGNLNVLSGRIYDS